MVIILNNANYVEFQWYLFMFSCTVVHLYWLHFHCTVYGIFSQTTNSMVIVTCSVSDPSSFLPDLICYFCLLIVSKKFLISLAKFQILETKSQIASKRIVHYCIYFLCIFLSLKLCISDAKFISVAVQ